MSEPARATPRVADDVMLDPLRVLCVSNMWPGEHDPDFGAFVAAMCAELGRFECALETAVIDRRGGGPARSAAKYLRLLMRTVRRARRADVIYAHFLFPTGAIALVAGAVARRPVVVTAHGQDVANLRRCAVRTLTRPVLRGAAHVVAVSDYLGERLRTVEPDGAPVSVVNMGVDLERFTPADRAAARARLGIAPDGPLVLAVGGLTERKNPLTLLQAFARLRAERPNARLAFVGDGPLAATVDAGIRHLLLEDAVLRPGAVEHAAVADWVDACDVLAMVSRVEPLGVAALEALAGGRPVVVTAVGGAREVVPADGPGRVVDPGDPAAIARALGELIDAPPGVDECRAAAAPHALALQARRVFALLRTAADEAAAERAGHPADRASGGA